MARPAPFSTVSELHHYEGGDVVFRQGDPGSVMYGVVAGQVELLRDNEVVARVHDGETFGNLGVIAPGLRTLSAVAATNSVIAVIDEPTLLSLLQREPRLALSIMRSLAARIRAIEAGTDS